MNRIDAKFKQLKEVGQTAFIGFVTLGDPDYQTSIEIIKKMAENGCDIIELGIPFSDPAAEGETIQAANLRALANGMNTKKAMNMVKELRASIETSLVYLLYYNQIFRFGIEPFFQEAAKAGIDGLIIPDLPYEHQDEIKQISVTYNIHVISLVTPVSKERKKMIASSSEGFLYCVTSLGVTGERSSFKADLKAFIEELKQYTKVPKALGFGINTVEQIKEMKTYADGIIIGSAIVKMVPKLQSGEMTINDLGAYIRTLSDATHS